ncbi:MAG: ATPase domain-containing protein [Verrucomicrobiota bacterium]
MKLLVYSIYGRYQRLFQDFSKAKKLLSSVGLAGYNTDVPRTMSTLVLQPALFGFRELFYGAPTSPGNLRRFGFPLGSTILLTGPPGSGKTTFAFACARDLLFNYGPGGHMHRLRQPGSEPHIAELYYISLEVPQKRLRRMFAAMGWFEDAAMGPRWDQAEANFDRAVLNPIFIVPDLREDRPPPGPEETVNWVLTQIRERRRAQAVVRLERPARALVIVDSLNALLKDCPDRGEARRQTYEFIRRLNGALGTSNDDKDVLALSFLIAEEVEEAPGLIPVPEYVVDFVFHFDLKDSGGGRQLRTFEVVKSQGANMRVGQTTWAMISGRDAREVMTQPEIVRRLRCLATYGLPPEPLMAAEQFRTFQEWLLSQPEPEGRDPAAWGTVAMFPRATLRRVGDPGQTREPKYIETGIPGFDQMLDEDPAYWARVALHQTPSVHSRGLIDGKTTLVIGEAGSGKTTMCLQFLQQDLADGEDRKKVGRKRPEEPAAVLYVNFENPLSEVLDLFPGNAKQFLDALTRAAAPTLGSSQPLLFQIHRRRGNLDLNILVGEIRYLIAEHNIRRVAIDGLSSLLATCEPTEYATLVESLLGAVRGTESPPAVMITYESIMAESVNHGTAAHLSGVADNVVVLRRVTVADENRIAIYVAKARDRNHDRTVREVQIRRTSGTPPLTILPGFEAYTDVLSGHPKPVKVFLQLFAENHPETEFNAWLAKRVRDHFDFKVKTYGFSFDAITTTLEELPSPVSHVPSADVRIVSVDEWWIREHPLRDHPLLWLVGFEPHGPAADPRSRAPVLSTTMADFWTPEIEKASLVSRSRVSPPTTAAAIDSHLLALPCYMDFGLFCANLELLFAYNPNQRIRRQFRLLSPATRPPKPANPPTERNDHSRRQWRRGLRRCWRNWLEHMPRLWALPATTGEWFQTPQQKESLSECETVVDLLRTLGFGAALTPGNAGPWGFAFNMETREVAMCAFLEFAWSFGAQEQFLTENALDFPAANVLDEKTYLDALPATQAFRFLMFLVAEGLMPAKPRLQDTRVALFSRHYYSTFVQVSGQATPSQDPPVALMLLPFFPVGAQDPPLLQHESILHAVHRLQQLLTRISAVAAAQPGSAMSARETLKGWQNQIEALRRQAIEWRRMEPTSEAASTAPAEARSDPEAALKIVESLRQLGDDIRLHCRDRKLEFLRTAKRRELPEMQEMLKCLAPDGADSAVEAMWPCAAGIASLDLQDVVEILDWHVIRLNLLERDLRHQFIQEADLQPGQGLDLAKQRKSSRLTSGLMGYPCTGSWMAGLYRRTQSPGLSTKILEEIVSLESAKRRAELGAGLPARKDFYEFYGGEPVTYAEYLSWRELYRFCGSRARRRDRIVCSAVRISKITELIHYELRSCLRLAERERNQAARYDSNRLAKEASGAIGRILRQVRAEMAAALRSRAHLCLDCPDPNRCELLRGGKGLTSKPA